MEKGFFLAKWHALKIIKISREHKLYTFVRSRGYMCLVTVANKYIKAFFRYPVIGVSKIVTGESPGTIEYIRLRKSFRALSKI